MAAIRNLQENWVEIRKKQVQRKSMSEIGTKHPLSYRSEVIQPLYNTINSADSAAIIGSSSMGKSRLINFLKRPDVIENCYQDNDKKLIFAMVDLHRMEETSTPDSVDLRSIEELFSLNQISDDIKQAFISSAAGNWQRQEDLIDWAFYEVILTSLTEACSQHKMDVSICEKIRNYRDETILNRNSLQAKRNLELAASLLFDARNLHLCFLFDEFDETYVNLPSSALSNLRALRDRFKYHISYVLFLRNKPAFLRDPYDHEGFYELFSRHQIGLPPYSKTDSIRIIKQIEERKSLAIDQAVKREVFDLSGGHPGMILALINISEKIAGGTLEEKMERLLDDESINDECGKLWNGFTEDEQNVLTDLISDTHISEVEATKVLKLKGILSEDLVFFSPILERYARDQLGPLILTVDRKRGAVRIGRKKIKLTRLEFNLVAYLYEQNGEVRSKEEILENIYPEDQAYDIGVNRVDKIVSNVRGKIENGEEGEEPIYLLTVRGHGFRLLANPWK